MRAHEDDRTDEFVDHKVEINSDASSFASLSHLDETEV